MAKRPTPKRRDHAPEVQLEVGLRVARLREALGLSKIEFARQNGYDRNYLARLENGEQNLELGSLVRLALALGETDLGALVGDIPIAPNSLRARTD